MERVIAGHLDQYKVREVVQTPGETEKLLFGLNRFPNVQVERLSPTEQPLQLFKDRIQMIKDQVGQTPLGMTLCRGGIYRSRVMAEWLVDNDLAIVGLPNLNDINGEVTGCGAEYLYYYGFGITEGGISISREVTRPADILIFNLSKSERKFGDKLTLTQAAMVLEELLSKNSYLAHPISIFWVDAIEAEIKDWLEK